MNSGFRLESRVGPDQIASFYFATSVHTKCRACTHKQDPQQPHLSLVARETALSLLHPTREASNDRCKTILTLEI